MIVENKKRIDKTLDDISDEYVNDILDTLLHFIKNKSCQAQTIHQCFYQKKALHRMAFQRRGGCMGTSLKGSIVIINFPFSVYQIQKEDLL